MEEMISRSEHEEFARRIDQENTRQNHRIQTLESTVAQISELASSVKTLAVNMENMLKEQTRQGERLESLEQRDGEMWRTVVSHIVTLIVGAVVAYAMAKIGF